MARTKFHSGQDFFKVPVFFFTFVISISRPRKVEPNQLTAVLSWSSGCLEALPNQPAWGQTDARLFTRVFLHQQSSPSSSIELISYEQRRLQSRAFQCQYSPSWTTWYIASASKIVESTCRRIAHIYGFSFISFRTVLPQSLHTLKS